MSFFVSIIIPCRNEEKYIGKCLDSFISQDYPKQSLEILVVDGISEDKTRKILKEYSLKYPFVKLLENPKKFTNFALNIGVKEAKGDLIMVAGAHAKYEADYLSKCVENIEKYGADNVGGVLKTEARENTAVAKSIALSLSDFFGTGGARFRTGTDKPFWTDTVFGDCYRKEVFAKIGLFNENLQRSQDMEFNLRLKRAGGKILLVPDIVAHYYPSATFKNFFSRSFTDGVWVTYPLKFVRIPFKLRHYIPFIFVSFLLVSFLLELFYSPFMYLFLGGVCCYILALLYFSARISLKEGRLVYFFLLPVAFSARHLAYGLGSIFGIIKLLK